MVHLFHFGVLGATQMVISFTKASAITLSLDTQGIKVLGLFILQLVVVVVTAELAFKPIQLITKVLAYTSQVKHKLLTKVKIKVVQVFKAFQVAAEAAVEVISFKVIQ